MEDVQGTYKTPAPCQQLQGMPRTPSCPALGAQGTHSLPGARRVDQRHWEQCHPMSSFAPDISVSVAVSNILPLIHELSKHLCHFTVSISKLHFLHGLFHPEAVQKSCRPCARIWVWKMFTSRKATDEQLFCSVQHNGRLQPVAHV